MIVGPKYKICKRLGSAVFEKCQSRSFTRSEARRGASRGRGGRPPRGASDYKRQLTEKQKMRYLYGLGERQLARYVDEAVSGAGNPLHALIARLESRLDNIVYRLGLAKTRRQARQFVSHGHITVSGRKMTVPSYAVREGEIIAVRTESKERVPFTPSSEEGEENRLPAWLAREELGGGLAAVPTLEAGETLFDAEQVLEYYSR